MNNKHEEAEIVQLYDDTSAELHRMLHRKLGNHHEADEVAQDAFEKICRLAEREDIDDLRRYFFAIANRMALNVLRHRGVETDYLTREVRRAHTEPDIGSSVLDPASVVSAREKLDKVKQALSNLSDQTRQVFLMHRFQDYSYKEIGEQLGISIKAVEYHMSRALVAVLEAGRAE